MEASGWDSVAQHQGPEQRARLHQPLARRAPGFLDSEKGCRTGIARAEESVEPTGVGSLERSRPCIERLAPLDYLYWPYRSDVMHWFCKPHPARRTHHLHLVPTGSRRYLDELAFRDALRSDSALAARYATLKRDLAVRFRHDREAYTRHKAPFVHEVLAAFRDGHGDIVS